MDNRNLWVAEYSAQQGCFHVATLEQVLQNNLTMVMNRSNNDYLPFGFYKTIDEAHAACDRMRRIHVNLPTPIVDHEHRSRQA